MRNWLSALIFLMLAIAVVGCRPDYTKESQAVERMLSVLERTEQVSATIDPRLVQQYSKDVAEKCERIQAELADTLALADAELLVKFCGLRSHLEDCLTRKEAIDNEVVQTRKQLFNLNLDLKNGTAAKDSVATFIESEFLFVESLDEGTEQLIAELHACFETYDELKDEIERLLIALPNRSVD